MATISRNFSSESTIENGTTLSGTTEEKSSDVDLETNGYVGAHVIVDVTWDGSGSENLRVNFYGSLDGTNYDDEAFFSQELAVSAGNTVQYSFIITDVLHFQVGFEHVASESNEATITCKYQAWNYTNS